MLNEIRSEHIQNNVENRAQEDRAEYRRDFIRKARFAEKPEDDHKQKYQSSQFEFYLILHTYRPF
jgi:hypothetical protein